MGPDAIANTARYAVVELLLKAAVREIGRVPYVGIRLLRLGRLLGAGAGVALSQVSRLGAHLAQVALCARTVHMHG